MCSTNGFQRPLSWNDICNYKISFNSTPALPGDWDFEPNYITAYCWKLRAFKRNVANMNRFNFGCKLISGDETAAEEFSKKFCTRSSSQPIVLGRPWTSDFLPSWGEGGVFGTCEVVLGDVRRHPAGERPAGRVASSLPLFLNLRSVSPRFHSC